MDNGIRGGAREAQRPALILRPLRSDDEAAFRDAHERMAAERFTFGLFLEPGMSWSGYLEALERQRLGIDLPDHLVPATFLVAEVDGSLVGRLSVRHELNEWLARYGGHIGYGVLPEHRGLGHATEILRQGVTTARAVGVERILVVCDDDNPASARVIERCRGSLESLVEDEDGSLVRRYWID